MYNKNNEINNIFSKTATLRCSFHFCLTSNLKTATARSSFRVFN